jgi:hypothetical protein
MGLSKESAAYLDMSSRGSFSQKSTTEGKEVLDQITKNSSFTADHGPLPEECAPESENILAAETSTTPSIPVDPALYDTPKPRASEDETSRSLMIHLAFEDDLFEDYGNASNYQCRGKPPIPINPPDPEEIAFFRDTVRELIAIMTQEWSKELKQSSEIL